MDDMQFVLNCPDDINSLSYDINAVKCFKEQSFGLVSSTSTLTQHQCISLQLELQCRELNSEKQESYVENVKLKMTNDELSRALENTSQELSLAQDQLAMLQDQAARLQQEKEM